MSICQQVTGFAVMILAVTISFANAEPVNKSQQIAQAGGAAAAAITLLGVVVQPGSWVP
jgi:hypothetical protein